ncbi:MAG TPA: FlgD immunoglobulin-like domain containing protein, partial [Vicinamibacteria bacterium]
MLAEVGWGEWAWSPDSERLARVETSYTEQALGEVVLVARDGTSLGSVTLPGGEAAAAQYVTIPKGPVWRGDGKIVASVLICVDVGAEAPDCRDISFVVDPDALEATRLTFQASFGAWSPDGGRVLLGDGRLYLEDGTSLGPLLPGVSVVSPRATTATYWKPAWDTSLPGTACGTKGGDTFAIASSANLSANLDVARLPGNGGLVVRGTAADRNLERFQLDYASTADPATWHPIGAALDVPVLDDVLTVWVPPGPGTYVLRLSVSDRAGHASVRTRVVSWERVPALANFTQSDYYLSPDGNGVKDAVLFRYTVLDPTRVDVRVVGPEPLGAGPAALEVWRAAFEHPTVGPRSFSWDGRDASGQVVPDGRYTVLINELPFRVEVDNTPPEIGMRFENLRAAPALVQTSEDCYPSGLFRLKYFAKLSSGAAERLLHVVDERLESWVFRKPERVLYGDSEPVFVPETGPWGEPLLDKGRPRVRREGGRPVDRRDSQFVLSLARTENLTLEAWDLAGNRTEVAVDPPPEAIVPLGAIRWGRCEKLATALIPEVTGPDGPSGQPVTALKPDRVVLQAGSSLRLPPEEQDLRLTVAPRDGGDPRDLALDPGDVDGHRNFRVDSFEALGLDPTLTYRARFRGRGESGEIASAPFVFAPCSQWLRTDIVFPVLSPRDPEPKAHVVTLLRLDTPALEARAGLWILREGEPPAPAGALALAPMNALDLDRFKMTVEPGEAAFFAPLPELLVDCANRLRVEVKVKDVAGRDYPNPDIENACEKISLDTPPRCSFSLRLRQDFPGCSGSPDVLRVESVGSADQPARVTIEGGPVDEPRILDDFVFEPTPLKQGFHRKYEVSVEGVAGDAYPLRGRIVPLDPVFGEGSGAQLSAVIDRSPPVGEILLPPEGGSLCRAPDVPLPTLQTLVRVDDASPHVEAQASWQTGDGSWRVVPRICDARCQRERTVPVGRPFELAWNVAELGPGPQALRLEFCDRSGNRGEAVRSLLVTDAAPTLQVWRIEHPVFSPNGDGLAEQAEVTVRLPQPGRLSVRVHAGSAQGPVVRSLWTDVPQAAVDVLVAWDGRGDGGQVLPDGEYALVFSIADACGAESGQSTVVTVDTVPPEVEIAEPSSGQRVSASVDVLGRATDPHFAEWVLDLSCGEATDWTRLERRTLPVGPGSFLARWDTSRAPPGVCRLRLAAMDEAENRSAEAFATATVERGELLEGLSATPDVFSPNGDGRRETVTLGYALRRSARVRLEVRAAGNVVRTLETGEERSAGPWSHVWDGLDDSGVPVAEGVLTLWVRAEDPGVPTIYEEKSIRLDLDRTPPRVQVSRPETDGFVGPATTVRGVVEDRNLALFTVSAAPAGSAAGELARGSQGSAAERDLASLSLLAEGPHVLQVAASDTAENEARLDRPFFMDATPPRAAIQSPASGAFLRRGETPILVTGLVGDDHLGSWTLRFGEGREPPAFVTIGQGVVGGAGIALGAWDVRFVPDGFYTLSLVATDRAGQKTESRIAVTLDGRPPVVAFALPTDGGYVTGDGPVLGTANDAHLASWELEAAPGSGATAFQWSPLGAGSVSVAEGTLADWSPLPPDGVYTLRLTARDEVDLTATAQATVTVDTTPPATPGGLRAKVTASRDGYGSVVLTWSPNTEPDLVGYRLLTPRAEDWGALVAPAAWDDGERVEGRYAYRVLAEDAAGNQSAPAILEVRVDLTPPLVSFSAPAEDGAVAGSVDVRGTAWSADDFAEYRLLVGAGEAPATWTTLRRSSVPVASGSLGAWLALVDGTYVLALEAEDTNGNEARVTRRVAVDTVPPEPPVLVDVAAAATPADQLTPSWQPSPSADVVGTLVLRNGRLANASSVVLGDRKGFLVPGTSFEDRGLPDGDHCYRVVAMDGAGNESAPSNEICRSLDNRPPRALIVSPPDGARFGYPVRVLADTPDLDVASVRFERRALGQAEWVAFGEVRSAPPWETTLDPKPASGDELAAGTHELRAVATDHAEATDPAPASIAVVYGDTTPPPAPTGLAAKVDGADVTLTWTPPEAADLASYRLYRDGARIAEDLAEPQRLDISLAPRTYAYAVTAVDADGNESAPSTAAEAIVYVLRLDQPSWPVVGAPVAAATGDGSRPGTTVRVLREEAGIAEAPGTGGPFRVEGVPLVPDGNVLRARGEDAAGNRSVPSDEIVLVSNAPPATVTGLAAEVDGAGVTLRWPAVADLDLAGYVVRRDGARLTASVPQDEASSIDATSRSWMAPYAFDGDPTTAWIPEFPGTGAWTVAFAEPVLVERVSLRFAPPDGSTAGTPAAYTILARWQDRDLPVVRVRGNTAAMAEHRLPDPFLTSALTIALESPAGLAEVAVERL